ncbi:MULTISPECIES: HlyD family secretion protein [unclassified Beijerinckia]|uniref:HlyD family secretion protein n=1 Tax=unclassified Beijerinckia TaxID=2638183 RepID=UPI000896E1E4|nr:MULTISPECIES: HlyD family secretion protein [unclassified Beijerinckia]MDH7794036.1 membrane fusion protein (multidrug efflux system) [Beijerinckia sp. GAS462]SEB51912.1 membrane fusion protein, multidrug efflux system [Beijerinckia sp. 28-YEA-48]
MSTTGLDSSDQTTAEITNIRQLRTAHTAPGPVTDEITPPETKARPDDLMPATPPPAEEPPVKETEAPKGSMTRRVLFALLPVMLVAGGYFYVTGGATMSTDNAYVQADTVGITTDVSGIVREVTVHDNQKVAKNDILFKLDDQQFKLALDRTQAQLDMTRNNLHALQTNYRDLQAQVEQAKKDVDFNTANFNRQQQLLTNSFTPRATFDASRNTLQTSQQKLASLQQQLAGVAANLNDTPDAQVETLPSYKEALAARDEAARQLAHTVVHAPFNGIVTNVPSLQPGQYLTAATTAFNIVSTDHVWVTANPKETELTYVQPGQKVTVDVDTYPGKTWTGTVDSISPASAASFSLLPAENTSGNWVKVVQRIPMRIRIETPADAPPLRIGMSVQVNVETGHSRGLPNFLTSWFHTSTGASNG